MNFVWDLDITLKRFVVATTKAKRNWPEERRTAKTKYILRDMRPFLVPSISSESVYCLVDGEFELHCLHVVVGGGLSQMRSVFFEIASSLSRLELRPYYRHSRKFAFEVNRCEFRHDDTPFATTPTHLHRWSLYESTRVSSGNYRSRAIRIALHVLLSVN